MTKTEAARLVATLAELYDQPAWTEGRLRLFTEAIVDLDYDHALRAVETWMQTKAQRPQPADIRHMVAEAAVDLPDPEEAYGMVVAYQEHPSTAPPVPAAVRHAVQLTGRIWDDIPYMQYDQYPWFRRDFLSAYREVRTRHVTAAQQGLPPPTGRSELERDEARGLLRAIMKGSA